MSEGLCFTLWTRFANGPPISQMAQRHPVNSISGWLGPKSHMKIHSDILPTPRLIFTVGQSAKCDMHLWSICITWPSQHNLLFCIVCCRFLAAISSPEQNQYKMNISTPNTSHIPTGLAILLNNVHNMSSQIGSGPQLLTN